MWNLHILYINCSPKTKTQHRHKHTHKKTHHLYRSKTEHVTHELKPDSCTGLKLHWKQSIYREVVPALTLLPQPPQFQPGRRRWLTQEQQRPQSWPVLQSTPWQQALPPRLAHIHSLKHQTSYWYTGCKACSGELQKLMPHSAENPELKDLSF